MSSGFISEAEISEQRRARQEEWDRVRTAEEPVDEAKGTKRKLSESSIETATEEKSSLRSKRDETVTTNIQSSASMKCIGILPGLGSYDDSSDSDCSSESEHEHDCNKYDLLGRAIVCKHEEKS